VLFTENGNYSIKLMKMIILNKNDGKKYFLCVFEVEGTNLKCCRSLFVCLFLSFFLFFFLFFFFFNFSSSMHFFPSLFVCSFLCRFLAFLLLPFFQTAEISTLGDSEHVRQSQLIWRTYSRLRLHIRTLVDALRTEGRFLFQRKRDNEPSVGEGDSGNAEGGMDV
jgi:hypothetical protein